jgi:hypothetical protein
VFPAPETKPFYSSFLTCPVVDLNRCRDRINLIFLSFRDRKGGTQTPSANNCNLAVRVHHGLFACWDLKIDVGGNDLTWRINE